MRSSIVATTLVAFLTVASQPLVAQSRIKPAAPGTSGDPIWQGVVLLSDGRRLVTDGGIAIDEALAKLPKLPEKEFLKDEYRFSDLKGPGRRMLPLESARFRMGGELQPVLILVDGMAVGVLMPVRK